MFGIRRCQGSPVACVAEAVWRRSRARFAFQACPLCYKLGTITVVLVWATMLPKMDPQLDWRESVSPSLHVDSVVSGLYLGSAVYVTDDLRCVGFDGHGTDLQSTLSKRMKLCFCRSRTYPWAMGLDSEFDMGESGSPVRRQGLLVAVAGLGTSCTKCSPNVKPDGEGA